MEKKLVIKSIMRSSSIQQVNEATMVLRHFIELSAKLLPFFNDLSTREQLLPREVINREQIIETFRGYKFDTSTSLILMNSSILATIHDAFKEIEQRIPGEDSNADEVINRFLAEHDKLVSDWIQTDCN